MRGDDQVGRGTARRPWSRSWLTRPVVKLEEAGLIERRPADGDGRRRGPTSPSGSPSPAITRPPCSVPELAAVPGRGDDRLKLCYEAGSSSKTAIAVAAFRIRERVASAGIGNWAMAHGALVIRAM